MRRLRVAFSVLALLLVLLPLSSQAASCYCSGYFKGPCSEGGCPAAEPQSLCKNKNASGVAVNSPSDCSALTTELNAKTDTYQGFQCWYSGESDCKGPINVNNYTCVKSKLECETFGDCRQYGDNSLCVYDSFSIVSKLSDIRVSPGHCYFDSTAMETYLRTPQIGSDVLGKDLRTAPIQKPTLEIRIPGVNLSDVQNTLDENNNIHLPWIPEYIAGVYKFLLATASIMAVVMIIMSGIRIVVSAGGEAQSEAYHRIGQVIIGLVILWGSNLILNTISPDLTQFQPLSIQYIPREEMPTLGTTKVDTSEDSSGVVATAGSHQPFTTNCSIQLTTQKYGKENKQEFYQKVQPLLTATTIRDRVVQVADIANACNVNFGSCGDTAGTISVMGGVAKTDCFMKGNGNCNDDTEGPKIFGISSEQRKYMQAWRCDLDADANQKLKKPEGVCAKTAADATKIVRDYMLNQKAAGKLPPDWPDSWANKLQPGDRITVYNGNKDLMGSHAVIFVGWAANGNAQVIQGGSGGGGTKSGKARGGEICIKSECGDKMKPLLYGYSAI